MARLFLLLLWLVILCPLGQECRAESRDVGSIRVLAPSGRSSVFVDDLKRCSKTPCVVNGLLPGKHRVLVLKGALVDEKVFDVAAGSKQTFKPRLKEARPTITINTDFPDAEIYLDGSRIGVGSVKTALLSGVHTVTFGGTYIAPKEQQIVVGALDREFSIALVAQGVVKIVVEPEDAEIFVDGIRAGKGQINRGVEPGIHELSVSLVGKEPFKWMVNTSPGRSEEFRVNMNHELNPLGTKGLFVDTPHAAWFWSSIALAGCSSVLAATSLGMFLDIRGDADSLAADYRAYGYSSAREAQVKLTEMSTQMNQWQIVGWVMLGLGVAAGASSIAAWFSNEKLANTKAAGIVVYPVLGEQYAGFGAAMLF